MHDSYALAHNSTSSAPPQPPPPLVEPTLVTAFQLPKESVYRVKGFIRFAYAPSTSSSALAEDSKDRGRSWGILNWAFGRLELVRAPSSFVADDEGDGGEAVRLMVMGERGEVRGMPGSLRRR
ncbi:hypothetical protein BJV78DRAFT_1224081 [Lactifluus subvellereus]|nr:hypothetical protein BJV78DRAFT_1224081 [Lactifluus subvellereus]